MSKLPEIRREHLRAFKKNPCWAYLRLVLETNRDTARSVRDTDGVTRDAERLHLGVERMANIALSITQTIENTLDQQEQE